MTNWIEHWFVDDKEYSDNEFWDIYSEALEEDAKCCVDDYIEEVKENEDRELEYDEAIDELTGYAAEENGKHLYREMEVFADDHCFRLVYDRGDGSYKGLQ